MIDYQCTNCLEIQKSNNTPEICNHCGAKNSNWINLSTNAIERIEPPEKPVSHPYKPKPIPPIETSEKTKRKTPHIVKKPAPHIIKKPTPPTPVITITTSSPKSPHIVIPRKAGLSLSRSTFNLNVPLGNNTVETIFVRNLNKGNVSGKVTSDYFLAKPKPASFSFNKYLFLNIHIDTKTIATPITRHITIRIESTSGDYDIKINLNVIKTTFWGGLKYIIRPWN